MYRQRREHPHVVEGGSYWIVLVFPGSESCDKDGVQPVGLSVAWEPPIAVQRVPAPSLPFHLIYEWTLTGVVGASWLQNDLKRPG